MGRFNQADRRQPTLLLQCLADYVYDHNSVRVVDVFVDELDLKALGFEGTTPAATGRPASCSRSTPMICALLNLLFFTSVSLMKRTFTQNKGSGRGHVKTTISIGHG